jgi:putative transposase
MRAAPQAAQRTASNRRSAHRKRVGQLPVRRLIAQAARATAGRLGLYLASESTLYRLQRRYGLRRIRCIALRNHVTRSATLHRAMGPNQVWSWDIAWLPSVVRGLYFYLYLVMDVWSRRIVGWRIAEEQSGESAAALIMGACRDGNVDARGLVLHADNGKPMRGSTMLATLRWLGVVPSFSRPHVSDDNPYSEALFRTLKHTPAYPRLPFADLISAQQWVARFVEWYNSEHRHSAIRYVTPNQRHSGREDAVLAKRHELYLKARGQHPERWTRGIRNWTPVGAVLLNPPQPRSTELAPQTTRQLS